MGIVYPTWVFNSFTERRLCDCISTVSRVGNIWTQTRSVRMSQSDMRSDDFWESFRIHISTFCYVQHISRVCFHFRSICRLGEALFSNQDPLARSLALWWEYEFTRHLWVRMRPHSSRKWVCVDLLRIYSSHASPLTSHSVRCVSKIVRFPRKSHLS